MTIKDIMTDENKDFIVVIDAKESQDTCDPLVRERYNGKVEDIPEYLHAREIIQTGRSVTTGLVHIDIFAPDLM